MPVSESEEGKLSGGFSLEDLKDSYILEAGVEIAWYIIALVIFLLFLAVMMPISAAIWPFY